MRERVSVVKEREPQRNVERQSPRRFAEFSPDTSRSNNPQTELFSASCKTLTSKPVIEQSGKEFGRMEDLIIDIGAGTIAFAVISIRGTLGFGGKYYAVPWEAFSVRSYPADGGRMDFQLILNLPREKIENAPSYSADNWPREANWSLLNSMYQYYGIKPYWE